MVPIQRINQYPPPPLEKGVHVFTTPISAISHTASIENCLNKSEQQRAARFIDPKHGRNFTLVRGLLRHWLACYLNQKPESIVFRYNKHGQPSVDNLNSEHFYFNISHSADMAAFAFGRNRVGIDIEMVKSMKNLDAMTRHIAHPKEYAEFQHLSEPEALDAFFRLWTRKEAFIKANGQGLSMGLRSIFIGTQTQCIPTVEYKNKPQPHWLIKDLPTEENYKLAVAIDIN